MPLVSSLVRASRAAVLSGLAACTAGQSPDAGPVPASAVAPSAGSGRSRLRDTLVLQPASPPEDGGYFRSHAVDLIHTTFRNGVAVQSTRFLLDKQVTEQRGRPVVHLVLTASADAPDPAVRADILLDRGTMALIRREDRDRDGLRAVIEAESTHVHGTIRSAKGRPPRSFDFTLAQPSFLGTFVDAAANAAELRDGLVLRVPTFGIEGRRGSTVWRYFLVRGPDTVRVQNRLFRAWLLEETATRRHPARRLWLTREPPYFPLELVYRSDGIVERIEQVERPSDDPLAVAAQSSSLDFLVASEASQGTLQAQVRAALAEVARRAPGSRLVKLRLFASGTDGVAEALREARRELRNGGNPLPVMSGVGVAGFPEPGRRVLLEATIERTHVTNPFGIGFFAGVASSDGGRALAGLARVVRESGTDSAGIRRVSCFYESLDQLNQATTALRTHFPSAEGAFVMSRESSRPVIECEAVGALARAPASPVEIFNLPGTPPSPLYSRAALVSTPKVILTGGIAVADSENAVRSMYDRISAAVAPLGGQLRNVVMADNYWITDSAREAMRAPRGQYFAGRVPAATGVFFTSLADDNRASLELVIACP